METNIYKFILCRVLLYLIITLMIIFILCIYLPKNTIMYVSNLKGDIVKILPQGWAFFTRNPQEEDLEYHLINNNSIAKYDFIGNRIEDYFGFKREKRAFIAKMSFSALNIEDKKWKYESYNKVLYFKNISSDIMIHKVNEEILNPLCNKKVLFIKKKPTPWAWRNFKDSSQIKYLVMEYKCN